MSNQFDDLRTFVAIVQGKGISAAARELGLVKSAVSRRLGELEDRLGARLINRSTRTLTLTEGGAEFYEKALRLISDLREAEEAASAGSAEVVGTLRIATPVSFTSHCLAPALGRFLLANPRLALDVETSDRHVDLVREGFDLALRITRLKDSSLIARGISTIRHALCASPAYLRQHGAPQTVQALARHQTVSYSYAEPRDCWVFSGGEQVTVHPVITMSNGDAIREAVMAGCGIGYLPTFIIYQAVQRGDLVLLLPESIRELLSLSILYPSSRNVGAKVRRFIDFCVGEFGTRPYWDDIIESALKRNSWPGPG
ncbi:LysR family transcriptional regulator [Massilia sp. CCM 8695]|uniref:LysR family transcriptional regulator n=1 Tax=Massilia frigida TaxID=2609281 RepID=A0ABX0N684_9BURK|nr:LysR family transcriptional regulator [Massilia frigida]NHZ78187.1 LysR family transcriptional regulator [Massilia frigida]